MRSLYLLRHGRAEGMGSSGDHERPLRPEGREAVRRVGEFLTRIGEAPDFLLCSTAERARSTAELALAAGEWDAALREESQLYEGHHEAVIDLLRGANKAHERVLVVGHQPTLGILIGLLASTAAPAFPPASLARIDFPEKERARLEAGSGELKWVMTPESLEDCK